MEQESIRQLCSSEICMTAGRQESAQLSFRDISHAFVAQLDDFLFFEITAQSLRRVAQQRGRAQTITTLA